MHSTVEALEQSDAMVPVHGTVDVAIPADVLWDAFNHPDWWPRWNRCFFWVKNKKLVQGRTLVWGFQPIRRWYPYKLPATAEIVEVEPGRRVTWEVNGYPGFFARHSYFIEDLGAGRCRFGSHEKAMGWSFRLLRAFWIAHFVFVKDRSLEGARTLEAIYQTQGKLDAETIRPRSYRAFFLGWLALLLLAGPAAWAAWFYFAFVRLSDQELAPGVHAVLGGGSSSLIVEDGDEVLLVDPKFPPGSDLLKGWITRHVHRPVTKIVNTHYHYDHTQGNELYPGARIYAHRRTRALMIQNDRDWWTDHPSGLPTDPIGDGRHTIKVGSLDVELIHSGTGHTAGDLWVYLPRDNIVATGDLIHHTYYPFFDPNPGGADVPGIIRVLRKIADEHPDATIVPGHGPIARADDLRRHADYLQFLYDSVKRLYDQGVSEDDAVRRIDLSAWPRKILPSYEHHWLYWATPSNNIRLVYRLLERDQPRGRASAIPPQAAPTKRDGRQKNGDSSPNPTGPRSHGDHGNECKQIS